jgi:hypothetical protein
MTGPIARENVNVGGFAQSGQQYSESSRQVLVPVHE